MVVEFPVAEFALEAVKRAAYTLMARVSVAYETSSSVIRCTLSPAAPNTDMAAAERDFRREVLDQDLRLSIEARTEPMRTAILGLAFSRTGLQDG